MLTRIFTKGLLASGLQVLFYLVVFYVFGIQLWLF